MVRVYAFLIEMYYLERNINIWFVNRVLGLLLLVARNPSFYSVGPQASNMNTRFLKPELKHTKLNRCFFRDYTNMSPY